MYEMTKALSSRASRRGVLKGERRSVSARLRLGPLGPGWRRHRTPTHWRSSPGGPRPVKRRRCRRCSMPFSPHTPTSRSSTRRSPAARA